MEIILNRIYLIIHPEKDKDVDDYSGYYRTINIVRNFLNRYGLQRKRLAYLSFLQDLGVKNIEELFNAQINFPFQESYLEFMNKITDSNLRRIFLIAHETIIAMKKDKINLETNKNGIWEINKDSISKLFIENSKSKWFFLNINQERIKKNNVSLFYAILHILHHEPRNKIKINEKKSYNIIKNKVKGISTKKIVQACETLSSKEWALIDFIGFYDDNDDNMEYKLNRKGLYYLEVANWKQYIKKYGNHNYIPDF